MTSVDIEFPINTKTDLNSLDDTLLVNQKAGECLCFDGSSWVNMESYSKNDIAVTNDMLRLRDNVIDTAGGTFTANTPALTADNDNRRSVA
jgi:hypothetical protein